MKIKTQQRRSFNECLGAEVLPTTSIIIETFPRFLITDGFVCMFYSYYADSIYFSFTDFISLLYFTLSFFLLKYTKTLLTLNTIFFYLDKQIDLEFELI